MNIWIITTCILGVLLVIALFRCMKKTENLTTCPAGCIPVDPNPCPAGYKINATTNMCAPAASVTV